MHVGVADHLGWAVVVTASADGRVADRRRIELVEDGVHPMPVHHGGEGLDDAELDALVADVRASARRATAAALARLADDMDEPVATLSLRTWPADFPTDVAVLRRPPLEARADAVMYRQVLAEVASTRGWAVRTYDARTVCEVAADLVLRAPRGALGPPWAKDHRVAYAAALAAAGVSSP